MAAYCRIVVVLTVERPHVVVVRGGVCEHHSHVALHESDVGLYGVAAVVV